MKITARQRGADLAAGVRAAEAPRGARHLRPALAGPVLAGLLLAASMPAAPAQPAGTIVTVAGSGASMDGKTPRGGVGDGGLALDAPLHNASSVAVDPAGRLYIADLDWGSLAGRVRRVGVDGIIGTVAGGGTSAPADGQPATSAYLGPAAVAAADMAGGLFIVEGSRVLRLSPDGTLTTVAGTGEPGFSGDGGPAAAAQLADPTDVAADAQGNLYIADAGNQRLRKVTPDGTITTLIGPRGYLPGGGRPLVPIALGTPAGVAVDRAGAVYVSDSARHRVLKIDAAGNLTTAAGSGATDALGRGGYSGDGGLAPLARLNGPAGVAADAAGDLFIADMYNHRIRRVAPNGTITTVAGNPGTVDQGGVSYTQDGFAGDGGPAIAAQLSLPSDVAVDGAGNLYIADSGNSRIREVFGVAAPGLIGGVMLSSAGSAHLPGDLNGDGAVDLNDALLLLRTLVGQQSPPSGADVNGDGHADVNDVVFILRKSVGL